MYAALGVGLALAHLSPRLVSLGSSYWFELVELLPQLGAEVLLAGLLGGGLSLLAYREYRPWQWPRAPRLGTVAWRRVRTKLPLVLLAYSVLLVLAAPSAQSRIALGLSLWYWLGYQVWECELDGHTQRLHSFFGVQWSNRLPVRRVVAQPDFLGGAAVLSRRRGLPLAEGPRSDDRPHRARTTRAWMAGVFSFLLAIASLTAYCPVDEVVKWIAVGLVALPPSILLARFVFLLLPSGVPAVKLPQPRRLSNPVVEWRAEGGLSRLGCGLLMFAFGGMYLVLLLVGLPLGMMYVAAESIGLSGPLAAVLTVLAVLALRLGPNPEKYFELEPGSRHLYQHDIREPYQFTRLLGEVVALGINPTTLNGSLPVAYTSDAKCHQLSQRGPNAEQASETVSRLAASLLVPVVPPTTRPAEVCSWINERSLADRLNPWPAPRRKSAQLPDLSPPLD